MMSTRFLVGALVVLTLILDGEPGVLVGIELVVIATIFTLIVLLTGRI